MPMVICPKCGELDSARHEENLAGYCYKCGAKMVEYTNENHKKRMGVIPCNWCQEDIYPHESYCTNCGKDRETTVSAKPPDTRTWFGKRIDWLVGIEDS